MSTGTAQVATPAASPGAPTQLSTNPYVGVLGVFLGASIATMNSRLLSVGLADLRGALGISFDQASWLPTALNMAMMFSGVFCVFLSVIYGPPRILLLAASVFTITAILLPFSANFWVMLALQVLAGLGSGTFYSLTMTFVLTSLPKRLIIFGIAAYAADIIFTSNVASALQGWYADHLSWRWIFWHAALVTPLMMLTVHARIEDSVAENRQESLQVFVGNLRARARGSYSGQHVKFSQEHRISWVAARVLESPVKSD